MPLTLSPKGEALLADLPAYYEDEPNVEAVQDVLGRELQRVEDAAKAIRYRAFPQNADTLYRTLGMWEKLLGLAVEPPGQTTEVRQRQVAAAFRTRKSGTGLDWIANVNSIVGSTTNWTHEELANYNLSVRIPYASGTASLSARQTEALIRKITPAHLTLTVSYTQGLIWGVSGFGERFG